MSPTDPVAAALLAAAAVPFDAEARARLRRALVACGEPTRLVAAARVHGMTALVHWRAGAFAPGVAFARGFAENTCRAAIQSAALSQVLSRFEEAGVPALPLKGPVLAAQHAEHPALRRYGDLDVLVAERDVDGADAVLRALGFVSLGERAAGSADVRRRKVHDVYARAADSLRLELHWRVAIDDYSASFEAEELLARARAFDWRKQVVLVPAAEDLILLLAVHGARHRWERLEWRHIFARALAREGALDWDVVWRDATRLGVRRMLAFALLATRAIAPRVLPTAVRLRAERDRRARDAARELEALAFAGPEGRPAWRRAGAPAPLWHRLAMRERPADRARLLWSALTVPGPHDRGSRARRLLRLAGVARA